MSATATVSFSFSNPKTYTCCLHLPPLVVMTARHLPLTRWQQRTTWVCGWSMATSNPSVCSNTFSLNTRSCACSRYFCKPVHDFSKIFWAFEVLELKLVCTVSSSREGKPCQLLHFFHFLHRGCRHVWINIIGTLLIKTELNTWYSMLNWVPTMLLLLAVQNYKTVVSIVPNLWKSVN